MNEEDSFFRLLFFSLFRKKKRKEKKKKKKGRKKAGKVQKSKESLCLGFVYLGYRKRFFVCVFSLFGSLLSLKKSRFCVERERERESVPRRVSSRRKERGWCCWCWCWCCATEEEERERERETGKERRISFALCLHHHHRHHHSPHCAFRCRVH